MSYVTHLECANCGIRYEAGIIHNLCTSCNCPLWVRYDLDKVKANLSKKDLANRPWSMWRYRELLPVKDMTNIVSLGETMTPLLSVKRLAAEFGLSNLFIKDESRLPTGSFKARGMAVAITMANEFGITKVAVPTAGNAGGAMAAYAARAGMEAYVFMPDDTPVINQKECFVAGAKTWLVKNGLIDDCGRLVTEGVKTQGWFNMSTLKEPYRIEGKKTMGLELAEQLEWELPDVILYPTGGGTGLIGMWKAFGELEALGWLKQSSKKPRMIACQSDTCSPIVRAFDKGDRFAEKFENARTIASGIRVPSAVGDFMILDAVRESGGMAISTPERDIPGWCQLACSKEGISVCPEMGACLGALETLVRRGLVQKDERIVIFNTGAGQKYPEAIQEKLECIDLYKPIELENELSTTSLVKSTMTNASLAWGCAFVAFGPSVSLLFLIAYQKAQLIIVVTTSAFAYLLAALFASFLWYLFELAGIGHFALIILLPGVIFQFLARCAFVQLYHKVEKVIEISIARHEEREEEFHESAKLRLELNDWACGIAAGVGFGGMHAIMLYGTLLASEAGNLGTLYQEACPNIPSLALSAFNAFLFSLLDIVWMLLTFYGMRNVTLANEETTDMPDWSGNTRTWGALVGTSNNQRCGHIALGTCMLSHLLAALATMPNQAYKGCRVSLSMLAAILLITSLVFWGGFSKLFLPDNQRNRLGMNGPTSPSQHRD